MRSHTDLEHTGRCPRCWVRDGWCICGHVTPAPTQTQIIIVRHQYEAWRSSGTARIAELAMPHCRLVQANPPYERIDQSISDLGAAWLLFPGGQPADQLGPPPGRLIVLDGTWREVRRLHRRLPALWSLPRFTLPAKSDAPVRLRRSRSTHHRSTLEAIADAIAELEGTAVAAPLHALHERFVEQSLRARGAWSFRRQLVFDD